MIAYDDLVVALSSWRASQGLPPNAVNFLSADTGSVDLALPIADQVEAMELATGEVHALDDEYAAEEYAAEEYAADDYAVEEVSVSDGHFAEEASDEAFDSMEDAEPQDDSASPVHALSYDDDESEQTAIASDFEAVTSYGDGASAIPPELDSPDYDSDMSETDDDQAMDALSSEAPGGDPQTEEVDVLREDFAASEGEGPTQFGNMDREATEMGVGIEELQRPGPRRDGTDTEE